MSRLLNEPVIISAVVNTGILMLISFGFNITNEQLTAIMAFVNAVLALVVRALVTPVQLAEQRLAKGYDPVTPIGDEDDFKQKKDK